MPGQLFTEYFLSEGIRAALDAGALGAFLLGAGSTILALSSDREMTIGLWMAEAASKAGVDGDVIVNQPVFEGGIGDMG